MDENGKPIIGAHVSVSASTGVEVLSVSTDINGYFELSLHDSIDHSKLVIEFSYLGYQTQQYTIEQLTHKQDIVMDVDPSMLGEVVVVGYGSQGGIRLSAEVHSENYYNGLLPFHGVQVLSRTFEHTVLVELNAPIAADYTLTLSDVGKKQVQSYNIKAKKGKQHIAMQLANPNLPAGVYVLRVMKDNALLVSHRVVKTN